MLAVWRPLVYAEEQKPLRRQIVLRLLDLNHSKNIVLNSRGISRPYAPSDLPNWLKTLKRSADWKSAITGLTHWVEFR